MPLDPLAPAPRAAIAIIGASIPRSGHHHLARLVRAYFRDDLRYCRAYDKPGCCLQAPCARPKGRRVTFQKSHDFTLRLPRDVPDAVYVVQHRHPVANTVSAAELIASKRGMRAPSDSLPAQFAYLDFLALRLAYFKRFHDKWVLSPRSDTLVIDHARLSREPAGVLGDLVRRVDGVVDEARLRAVLDALRDQRAKGAAYVPRKVEDSPFFDQRALAAFEAAVIDQCPAFGYAPTLGGAGYRRHPIWALAHLRHGYGRPLPRNRPGPDVM